MTTVAAHGDAAAWSRWDESADRYRLVLRTGERTRRLPLRGRSTPFDVDLGPGPDGRLALVYSRCAREPLFTEGGSANGSGRGCDVYRYDVRTRRERRVRGAATKGRSE